MKPRKRCERILEPGEEIILEGRAEGAFDSYRNGPIFLTDRRIIWFGAISDVAVAFLSRRRRIPRAAILPLGELETARIFPPGSALVRLTMVDGRTAEMTIRGRGWSVRHLFGSADATAEWLDRINKLRSPGRARPVAGRRLRATSIVARWATVSSRRTPAAGCTIIKKGKGR